MIIRVLEHSTHILLVLAFLGLSACGYMPGDMTPSPTVRHREVRPANTESVKPNTLATTLPRPTQTSAPSATMTAAVNQICSPLAGYGLAALAGMVVNPFAPPSRQGSDDPHQGIDLAVLAGEARIALPGEQVQAILSGVVAGVTADRFPYGNAVLVETGFDGLPVDVAGKLPTPAPTPVYQAPLNCPSEAAPTHTGRSPIAVYILYAHMQSPPPLQVGQKVKCGQTVGRIGASGNALNPHLHIETRVGPAGVRFGALAHYEPRANAAEMAAYCAWRIQGEFQLLDPGILLWNEVGRGTVLATPMQ